MRFITGSGRHVSLGVVSKTGIGPWLYVDGRVHAYARYFWAYPYRGFARGFTWRRKSQ